LSYLELTYRSFISRISGVNKKDILFGLSRRTLLVLISFVAASLVLISIEAAFRFPSDVRKFLFLGSVIFVTACLVIIAVSAILDYLNIGNEQKVKTYAKKI